MGRINVSVDFWTSRNFDRNFAKAVAPPSDGNKNCLALLKKGENRIKYKLLCPRGTQTCALAVANIKVNGNTAGR